jgi:hypothetical protein
MDLMRQGQQNRRGRGRNNNHQHNRRGGQNPLTRSFESAGPDTKIRGTPGHIAEKYMALARDAQSSGDPVLAENYLQHAEHYNRIILAYREQMQQSGEFNGGPQPVIARFRPGPQDPMSPGDDFGESEGEEFAAEGAAQPTVRPNEPQPAVFESGPRDGGEPPQPRFENRGPRQDNQHHYRPQHYQQGRDRQGGDRGYSGDRRDRQDRFDRQDRQDRAERQDRPERQDRFERGDRQDRSERFDRQPRGGEMQADGDAQQRRSPRPMAPPSVHEQPEFLRRPLRRPRREDGDAAPAPAVATDEPAQD